MFIVNFHVNPMYSHHLEIANSLLATAPEWLEFNIVEGDNPKPCNVAICWSFHFIKVRMAKTPTLVLENGWIDSEKFYSISLNSFGRLSTRFVGTPTTFEQLKSYCKPIRKTGSMVLVLGQCGGDYSLRFANYGAWLKDTVKALGDQPVWFRQHPKDSELKVFRDLVNYRPKEETLEEALSDTYMAIAYNSGSLVDAVIQGVPAIWFADTQCMVNFNSNTDKARDYFLRSITGRLWPKEKLGAPYFWNWLKRKFC